MVDCLSEKIRFLLKCGYKQTQLANLIGCGQSMVSMMKDGYEPKNQRTKDLKRKLMRCMTTKGDKYERKETD